MIRIKIIVIEIYLHMKFIKSNHSSWLSIQSS